MCKCSCDYVKFQDHHPPCVELHYRECMEKLGTDRQYVITSDDVEWCKTIFTGDNFVFNDVIPEGVYKPHFDFAVGTLCDDFIIANSTFSCGLLGWVRKRISKSLSHVLGLVQHLHMLTQRVIIAQV